MRLFTYLSAMVLAVLLMAPYGAFAQDSNLPHRPQFEYRGRPFGQFCPGMGRGLYGRRVPVIMAEDAKRIIRTYFAGIGEDVTLGNMQERRLFFVFEVMSKDGHLIDTAIVDKRTGRIRSIY
jgi:hypothetical protein